MKKYLFYIIVLYSSCQPNYERTASKNDCDKFRKGRFFHRSQADPTLYRIERSDTIQTEFIGKTEDHVNLKIKWTEPCKYELTFLDQHISEGDTVPDAYQHRKIKVEILKIQNDTCFIITNDGTEVLRGVVYIDKK